MPELPDPGRAVSLSPGDDCGRRCSRRSYLYRTRPRRRPRPRKGVLAPNMPEIAKFLTNAM